MHLFVHEFYHVIQYREVTFSTHVLK